MSDFCSLIKTNSMKCVFIYSSIHFSKVLLVKKMKIRNNFKFQKESSHYKNKDGEETRPEEVD